MSRNLNAVRVMFDRQHDAFELMKSGEAPYERFYHPEVVADLRYWRPPGMRERYEGIDGVRELYREWFSTWQNPRWEAEFHERGDFVVAVIDMSLTGVESGTVTPMPRHAQLFRFRDGLVDLHVVYPEAEDALTHAGIQGSGKRS